MIRPDLKTLLEKALSRATSASSDFDLNENVALPKARRLTSSAVLLCVRPDGGVILTKRSAKLKNHPGQIAFPGGRKDGSDVTLTDTALREAEEEIGLPPSCVEVVGTLPTHETVTGFQVTPVVGLLKEDFDIRPEQGEVAEVFDVPLMHLLNSANFRVEGRRWQGHRRYYYAVPYGPYYIWGATARILRGIAQ